MTVISSKLSGAPAALLAAILLWALPGPDAAAQPAERDGATAPEQVAVSGIVNDAEGASFRVDYGEGEITVEMAGWAWYGQAGADGPPPLHIGERVTVTGPVDDEFYRARRLKARTVYVRDRDTIYTTSWLRDDEESWDIRPMPGAPIYGGDPVSIRLAGRVSAVGDQRFTLDLGASVVRVDTGAMLQNPLDDIGTPTLDVGHWVQVGAELDNAFFRDRRLEALRITRIVGDETDAF